MPTCHHDLGEAEALLSPAGPAVLSGLALLAPRQGSIVNESTRWIPLIIVVLIMVAISLALLRRARQQGWW